MITEQMGAKWPIDFVPFCELCVAELPEIVEELSLEPEHHRHRPSNSLHPRCSERTRLSLFGGIDGSIWRFPRSPSDLSLPGGDAQECSRYRAFPHHTREWDRQTLLRRRISTRKITHSILHSYVSPHFTTGLERLPSFPVLTPWFPDFSP